MQAFEQKRELGRVAAPVAGLEGDRARLSAAAALAAGFDAEVAVLFAPPDPAELTPWLGESFGAGMPVGLIETLEEAGREGERLAREAFAALDYPHKRFQTLASPIWRAIATECRLADLVVFDDAASKGQGPFAETFEQVLIEERAAVFVAREAGFGAGPAVVAWDGSDGASRAARRAVPLLRRASAVLIAGAPTSDRPWELAQLQAYYALRGVAAELRPLGRAGAETAGEILSLAKAEGAGLIVTGAFGKSRLREFIFGGVTRALLQGESPSLFLAH